MPSRSHAKCRVCRKIIHARHRFGMCKQCSDKHYAKLSAQRRETKARQARRQAALVHVLEEGPAMTEQAAAPDKSKRPPRIQLTDDQRVEILDAYTTTSEPVKDLSARFGIKETYIYNVLDRVGVSWRRGNPESYETWQANQAKGPDVEDKHGLMVELPVPQQKALENMLKLPVLPPKPEPVAPTPSVERRVHIQPMVSYEVTVSGTFHVMALDIMSAMQELIRKYPDLRVTGIREA